MNLYRRIVMRFLETVGIIALNGTAVVFFFTGSFSLMVTATVFVIVELAVIFFLYFYIEKYDQ